MGGVGALVVLTFVFASFLALVPVVMAFVSIMTTFLLLLGLTELTAVSPVVLFLIALIGLGVAIDYALIVVSRWREERTHGRSGDEAVQKAMETAGRAVIFSGITVAIGLLALIALPLPFLRSMGYGGMLIPLVSVLVAITLLPVVLSTVGARLDWPHRRTDDKASRAWTRWAQAVSAGAGSRPAPGWPSSWRSSWPRPTCSSVRPMPTRSRSRATPRMASSRSRRPASARERCCRTRSSSRDRPTLTPSSRRCEGSKGSTARSRPMVRRGDPATAAVVEAIPIPDSGTPEGEAHLEAVRSAADETGSDVSVGGIPASNADFIDAVYGSFPLMIALIAVSTFILLARAFRSLLLPLKAILLNILSVGAAWGVLVLVWQSGYGSELIWGTEATGSIPSWMPADGVRVPVRPVDGLRGVHPQPDARGVRPHRLDRDRGDRGHRPDRAPGDERRA